MIQTQKRMGWTLTHAVGFVWGGGMVAGLLAAVLERAPVPGFLTLGVAIPLALLVALIGVTLVASLLSNIRLEQVWSLLLPALPFALIAGTIAGASGIWNDGSGSVALAPLDAMLFVVTGGILPLGIGPLAVVRVTVLVCCVAVVLMLRARQVHAPRAILTAALAWIVASLAMLSESWIVLVASWFRGLALTNALDATRIIGVLHTNSYWSAFQADRFLVGIGETTKNASTLAAAALIFLFAIVFLKVSLLITLKQKWSAMRAMAVRLYPVSFLLVASPLVAGYLLGAHNQRYSWNGLDVIAILVAIPVVLFWHAWWRFGRDIEDLSKDEIAHPNRPLPSGVVQLDEMQMLRGAFILLAFVGSFLLGWPVVALMVALFLVAFMGSGEGFGWSTHPRWRIPLWCTVVALLVMLGGVIGARSAVLPRNVFSVAFVWAIAAGLAIWRKHLAQQPPFWLRYGFFVILGGGWLLSILLLQ